MFPPTRSWGGSLFPGPSHNALVRRGKMRSLPAFREQYGQRVLDAQAALTSLLACVRTLPGEFDKDRAKMHRLAARANPPLRPWRLSECLDHGIGLANKASKFGYFITVRV